MLERILQLMKEQKINKSQLAKLCNLPKTTIYTLLTSDATVENAKLETMRPIALALNITLDFIISGNCAPKISCSSKLSQLNVLGQKKVDDYIDDLLKSGNYEIGNMEIYPHAERHAQYAAANGDDSNLSEAKALFDGAVDKSDDN